MKQFGRLLTAMVTPFDRHGKVDYEQAKKLALALLDSGSDGLVVTATTGESPTLFPEERIRLNAEVKAAVGDRAVVIANTSNNDTLDSIELTREVEKTGVDGFLMVVPYYNKPPQEGLYQHFKAIAEATSLPCMLYNVPSRTVVNLSAETVIRLSKVENIVAIKEASSNMGQIARIIEETDDDFLVYSGNDTDLFPVLSLGGYGVVGVASHIIGKQMKQMIIDYIENRPQEAAALHRKLLPFMDALFVISNPIPIKFALNHLGFYVGSPRLPLIEADENTRAVVIKALSNCTVDLPIS